MTQYPFPNSSAAHRSMVPWSYPGRVMSLSIGLRRLERADRRGDGRVIDPAFGEQSRGLGGYPDRQRAKHAPVDRPRQAERAATPAESEDLLEPAHLGHPGVGLDAGRQRVIDQPGDQRVARLAPRERAEQRIEAEAGDFPDLRSLRRLGLAELGKQAAEKMRTGRLEQPRRGRVTAIGGLDHEVFGVLVVKLIDL